MQSVVKPFYELLQLNSRLFVNCLKDMDDEAARTRINERTNNVAFISTHVVDARYYLARLLGVEAANPLKEDLEGLTHIEEFTKFPVVRELRSAWREVSRLLSERFASLTADELQSVSSQSFPIDDDSVLGAIAFLLQHESYHIGQLGFLRKCFELAPMSYSE